MFFPTQLPEREWDGGVWIVHERFGGPFVSLGYEPPPWHERRWVGEVPRVALDGPGLDAYLVAFRDEAVTNVVSKCLARVPRVGVERREAIDYNGGEQSSVIDREAQYERKEGSVVM